MRIVRGVTYHLNIYSFLNVLRALVPLKTEEVVRAGISGCLRDEGFLPEEAHTVDSITPLVAPITMTLELSRILASILDALLLPEGVAAGNILSAIGVLSKLRASVTKSPLVLSVSHKNGSNDELQRLKYLLANNPYSELDRIVAKASNADR